MVFVPIRAPRSPLARPAPVVPCCRPTKRSTHTLTVASARPRRTDVATRFYEAAWSRPDGATLLTDLVAVDHVQRDAVWQAGVESVGRDRLAKGMRHMRRVYPDLAFTVDRVAESDDGSVFVQWTFTGTFEGRADTGSGVTVFTFDGERIAKSTVYRTALPAEVDLAERSARSGGPVRQGVLLQGRQES